MSTEQDLTRHHAITVSINCIHEFQLPSLKTTSTCLAICMGLKSVFFVSIGAFIPLVWWWQGHLTNKKPLKLIHRGSRGNGSATAINMEMVAWRWLNKSNQVLANQTPYLHQPVYTDQLCTKSEKKPKYFIKIHCTHGPVWDLKWSPLHKINMCLLWFVYMLSKNTHVTGFTIIMNKSTQVLANQTPYLHKLVNMDQLCTKSEKKQNISPRLTMSR